jgi:signal transduction histidine kinase
MAWDIGSIQTSNPQLRLLRKHLLLSYLGVIAAVLGTFAVSVYQWVAHDRNQQLNDHLRQLAESAARTMEIVKHEHEELEHQEKYRRYAPIGTDGTLIPLTISQLMGKYRADSVLQIPSYDSAPNQKGVEWYNEQRRLMIKEGDLFPHQPLPQTVSRRGLLSQQSQIRSFVLPVYQLTLDGNNQLMGYIRASESTTVLEAELQRLRWGLGLGGVVALGLTAIGGVWLTQESLKPVVQSLEQLKQFTADASHELRSPLTAVQASVAVMQSHPERVHPADVKKLDAIASASKQMTCLVEDLLLLARMDSQQTNCREWIPIAIDEILEDLIEMAEIEAERKGIALKSNLMADSLVQGNAEQLKRLFDNLLSNALHYTTCGGRVTVSMQSMLDNVVVSVEDTGIGIAPEHLPLIFDRFWRADPARSHREGGTGLGLAIAQTIAQHHGGKIIVHSQLGVGSCFQIHLPLV